MAKQNLSDSLLVKQGGNWLIANGLYRAVAAGSAERAATLCFYRRAAWQKVRQILLSVLLLFSFNVSLSAERKDSVAVYGRVMDSFTGELLCGAFVEFVNPDGIVFDTLTTNNLPLRYGQLRANLMRPYYASLQIPRKGQCSLRVTKEGYQTAQVPITSKAGRREHVIRLEDVELVKNDVRMLGEVAVQASLVKMVVKGDTTVYNASAFQLADGSMLDALLRMLPGFKIQNGRITVDGEFVSSLLVNGEHFFRGDPRVALENLPVYMVDKVKTYHKAHPWSYITNDRTEDLPLVVDVNLKRQYNIGWVANAEAGYGTADRYMARLFGLRFTDNSRIAVFANCNNLCDYSEPGTSGNWSGTRAQQGEVTRQSAGTDLLIKDRRGRWKYTGDLKYYRDNMTTDEHKSVETFYQKNDNILSRNHYTNRSLSNSFSTNHHIEVPRQLFFHKATAQASFARRESNSDNLYAEFSQITLNDGYRGATLDSIFAPIYSERLQRALTNSQHTKTQAVQDTWAASANYHSFAKIPHTPDYITLDVDFKSNGQSGHTFQDFDLKYGERAQKDDVRHSRYTTSPQYSVQGSAKAEYQGKYSWGHTTADYTLRVSHNQSDYNYHRLDWLADSRPDWGCLPSRQQLAASIDWSNTYNSATTTVANQLGLATGIWLGGKKSQQIRVEGKAEWLDQRLDYTRNQTDYDKHRAAPVFKGGAGFSMDDFSVMYYVSNSLPDLMSLLPIRNEEDPTNIYTYNTNLRNTVIHEVKTEKYINNYKKKQKLHLTAYWRAVTDAIAYGYDYDEKSGQRIHMSRNVDGNWSAGAECNFSRTFTKPDLTLSTRTKADYNNSVDYVSAISTVRNTNLYQSVNLGYTLGKVYLSGNASVKYLHAEGDRLPAPINSFDTNYGISLQATLPYKFQLGGDLMVSSRYGYDDPSMNETRYVTNLRLSRSVLNGRMTLMLDAYDIFNQLSNVYKTLNAQAQTEVWYNAVPRYVLFHAVYRFSSRKK